MKTLLWKAHNGKFGCTFSRFELREQYFGGRNSKVVACLAVVNLADWLYTLKRHFPDADKFAARKFRCLGTMRYAALNVIVWERQLL